MLRKKGTIKSKNYEQVYFKALAPSYKTFFNFYGAIKIEPNCGREFKWQLKNKIQLYTNIFASL